MATVDVDVAVIGAGVVGLAIARELAQELGREVLLIEQHQSFGSETSSRNSEVVHSGAYYKPSSLKAQLCVEGNRALYEYCRTRNIDCKKLTKLIVATCEDQVPQLQRIKDTADANGCDPLSWMTREDVLAMEPEISCVAALFSPSTGVVDSHGLMLSLLAEAENSGCTAAYGSTVVGGNVLGDGTDGVELSVGSEGGQVSQIKCNTVINAAGLHAHKVASKVDGVDKSGYPLIKYSKGNYFALSGKPPAQCLVYPVPTADGLGTHLTIDLSGQGKFGPDTEDIDEIDYNVNASRERGFYELIRRFWPNLPDGSLRADYSGIRPQLVVRTGEFRDFCVRPKGQNHLINLFGIESPGLTASLALARHVARLVPK